MPQTTVEPAGGPLSRTTSDPRAAKDPQAGARRGFGHSAGSRKRKSNGKRSPALSKADWGPLGKHPDLEAIVARQRLHLPLIRR